MQLVPLGGEHVAELAWLGLKCHGADTEKKTKKRYIFIFIYIYRCVLGLLWGCLLGTIEPELKSQIYTALGGKRD